MSIKHFILPLILIGSCTYCKQSASGYNLFKIPIVITSGLSKEYIVANSKEQTNGYGEFPIMGKFPFKDTIDLTIIDSDFEGWDDPDWKGRFGDVFPDYTSWVNNDTLDVNGLELFFDYSQTIWSLGLDSLVLPYYPVFLVNSTESPKIFTGWDHQAIGAQEAYSSVRKEWVPLDKNEINIFGCGNGYMVTIIYPKEFLLLLVKKYTGDYRPEMRLNFTNGESSLVSKHFIGHTSEEIYSMLNTPK